jgi:hypothetical protein
MALTKKFHLGTHAHDRQRPALTFQIAIWLWVETTSCFKRPPIEKVSEIRFPVFR